MNIKNTNTYRFASRSKFWLKRFFNTLYYLKFRKDSILIDSWIEQWFGAIEKRNFGDELNVYLIEGLTGKRVINASNTLFKGNPHMVIGSIVEAYSTSKSIIWGSGAISGGDRQLADIPLQIRAVRGVLTRQYLIDKGIYCPSIYGDPALLTPLLYNPDVLKKYKYGIIPHVEDLEDPKVVGFINRYHDLVHLISFKNYGDWHDVIDQIKSCEVIISSSLHGLILSDAYGIPNVWVKISDKILGGEFKYKDYFSGVNRAYAPPLYFTENITIELIRKATNSYCPIEADITSLINACPWDLVINNN